MRKIREDQKKDGNAMVRETFRARCHLDPMTHAKWRNGKKGCKNPMVIFGTIYTLCTTPSRNHGAVGANDN